MTFLQFLCIQFHANKFENLHEIEKLAKSRHNLETEQQHQQKILERHNIETDTRKNRKFEYSLIKAFANEFFEYLGKKVLIL